MKKCMLVFFLVLFVLLGCKQASDNLEENIEELEELEEVDEEEDDSDVRKREKVGVKGKKGKRGRKIKDGKVKTERKSRVAQTLKENPEDSLEEVKDKIENIMEELELERVAREQEPLYNILVIKVKSFREELEREKRKFNDGGHSFPKLAEVLWEIKEVIYTNSSTMDHIYKTLGYDVSTLERLEEMLSILWFSDTKWDGWGLADTCKMLLSFLRDLGDHTSRLVGWFSDEELDKLKNRETNLFLLNGLVDQFILLRKDLVKAVQDQILMAQINKNDMEQMKKDLSLVYEPRSEILAISNKLKKIFVDIAECLFAKKKAS
ncbi:hypothetical protein DB313_04965 (plasmid) [Borrelia turcica IST7]|uniref:Blasticidin-S acetyltransferase n=1 Tax=Borrelia turcica IST7 TaxID=1104446 RepID=A0A386PNJ1_9SPIR|nr:hypothetical protein [Borrelia turcica]AYE36852.1 hypothetical protein DB313_04965 [Borrelia turcica IST7]